MATSPVSDALDPIALVDIEAAAAAIDGVAEPTPVVTSSVLDELVNGEVFIKAESAQRSGSFKFRGAYHRLSAIPDRDRSRGVVAVSSGNHGGAVACAAQLLGIPAIVYVPDNVAEDKRDRIIGFGAEVVTFDWTTADREGPARAHADRLGATFVHPFEDPLVMAGQGTVALELHRQVGPLDGLMVPIGGGGLMAGCGSAMAALDPDCILIGVEPAQADDTRRSFEAGTPVLIDPPHTIADGLAVRRPGTTTFAINRLLVREILTVTEDEIVEAMRFVAAQLDLRAEPSAMVGVAALLAEPSRWTGRRLGLVLTGGNIDAARFDALTTR